LEVLRGVSHGHGWFNLCADRHCTMHATGLPAALSGRTHVLLELDVPFRPILGVTPGGPRREAEQLLHRRAGRAPRKTRTNGNKQMAPSKPSPPRRQSDEQRPKVMHVMGVALVAAW